MYTIKKSSWKVKKKDWLPEKQRQNKRLHLAKRALMMNYQDYTAERLFEQIRHLPIKQIKERLACERKLLRNLRAALKRCMVGTKDPIAEKSLKISIRRFSHHIEVLKAVILIKSIEELSRTYPMLCLDTGT